MVGEYFRKAAEENFLNDTLLDDRLFIEDLRKAMKESGITMHQVEIRFMAIVNLASPPPCIIPKLTGI